MFNFALTQIKVDYTESNHTVTINAPAQLELSGLTPVIIVTENQIISIPTAQLELLGISPVIVLQLTPSNPKFIFNAVDREFIFKAPIRQTIFKATERIFIFKDKKNDSRQ